jgi:hypothetical protein
MATSGGQSEGRAVGTEMVKSGTACSIDMMKGASPGGHNDGRVAGNDGRVAANDGRVAGGQSQEVSALARVVQSALSISALDSRAGDLCLL